MVDAPFGESSFVLLCVLLFVSASASEEDKHLWNSINNNNHWNSYKVDGRGERSWAFADHYSRQRS